jgi:peroxiredoxin
MRTLLNLSFVLLFLLPVYAQPSYVSDVKVRTLDGSSIELSGAFDNQVGTILVFWEKGDRACGENLENLNDIWVEEFKEYGVEMVAVCMNNHGQSSNLKPFVSGKDWEFTVLVDENGELKRRMGITKTPYTILLDENQEVKCRYPGYCSGDEEQVCRKILKCLEQKKSLAEL